MKIIRIAQSELDLTNWLKNQDKELEQVVRENISRKPDGIGGNADFWKIPDSPFGIRFERAGKPYGYNSDEYKDPFPERNFWTTYRSHKY